MSERASVSAIYVYPVKACRGVRVTRARILRRGFEHDRRWMVVDDSGRFISQREQPALCRVSTSLHADGIRLAVDGHGEQLLPYTLESGEERSVSVWSHSGVAVVHGAASRWLSAALGQVCSLVYMPERHERQVNPERARPGDIVSFADGYPFLVISEASLSDLNARLATPLEMRRFRPNIVVSGVEPYAEDSWRELSIGAVSFRAVKRCDRCVVTTLDPDSGERGKEPLATLAKYRQSEGKVWFGMNLIHDGEGSLAVADPVVVRRAE